MKQRILALCCAFSLLLSLLAGCTAADGVELDKVMQNVFGVPSYEGSRTVSYEFTADKPSEGKPDYTAIAKGQLLMQIKQEDKDHTSMTGELRSGSAVIPFKAYKSGSKLAFTAEGSAVPLLAEGSGSLVHAGAGAMPVDLSNVDWQRLITANMSSLLKYMPNPKTLTVTDTKVTINGEALDLKRIHTELTGAELAEALRTGINNLLADTQQGDALIKGIVDDVIGSEQPELIKSFAVAFVKQYLQELADHIGQGTLAAYLNDTNSLKLDLYADKDSQVRRIAYDLQLSGLKLAEGVTGLKVSETADRWNLNGSVKAEAIDTTGAISIVSPGAMARYIKTLDPASAAYQLLVKDLKVTRKHLVLPSGKNSAPGQADRPYIDPEEGVTLVPVRYVTENLDADVQWLADTQQVKVTDIISGKTLLFTIGSKTVLVNGKPVELESGKAVLTGGYTFVPLRFIAEQFGAKVEWNDETWVATIIRN